MNIFVFENVLYDYTGGMAVIAANDLQEAQMYAFKEFGDHPSLADFLEVEPDFNTPAGTYPAGEGVNPGVLHYVHGGG